MIAILCPQCALKLQVKDEFAGRRTKCPACKTPLTVPVPRPAEAATVPQRFDGAASALARAGVQGDVTLAPSAGDAAAGRPSVREALAGKTLKGERYLLQGEIARGGMGAVLRAVDCDVRREVAVKFLLDQSDPAKKQRFVEEAQITGQLEHPNIVPIHELSVDGVGRLFFAMKMVKGRSLAQILEELRQEPKKAEKAYPLGRLLTCFVGVCNALAYAHARGVIHRDLKPANIMIGDFGEVYVMDWGLAKVLKGNDPAAAADAVPSPVKKVVLDRDDEADLTREGAVMGTPVYMPPEQAGGQLQAVDQRSDVYSLGAILYEFLTLEPPIDKEGGYLAILMRVAMGEIASPEQRNPRRARAGVIPRELSAVAMKALAKQPENRYPNVEALRRDVERFQVGRSVSAKQDSWREALVKFVRRNKAFSATAAVAALLLAVVLGFSFKINHDARLRAETALTDFQGEQTKRQEQARNSVPAFLRAARLSVNERQFDDALAQVDTALKFDPENADAPLLKGKILLLKLDFDGAINELQQYLRLRPDDADAGNLIELCRKARPDDPRTLTPFIELFLQTKEFGVNTGLSSLRDKLLEPYRARIEQAWSGLGDRLKMNVAGKLELNLGYTSQVTSLAPLKGMPLSKLDLTKCQQVQDLRPLKGMPLLSLSLQECAEVQDLTPLHDLPLTSLNLFRCSKLQDLRPLKGLQLTILNLQECSAVSDLTGLQGLPLTNLMLAGCFQVKELGPLRNMPLTTLTLTGCGQVHDLAPLRNLPLTTLSLSGCSEVRDLGPLREMPVKTLDLYMVKAEDLTPLEGMPLEWILFNPRTMKKGIGVLRRMKTLNVIIREGDSKPYSPVEFWKRYDAKEFN